MTKFRTPIGHEPGGRRRFTRNIVIGGLASVAAGGLASLAVGGLVEGAGPPAATTVKASVKKGTLTVTGTAAADVIVLRLQAGSPQTLEIDVGGDGTADLRADRQRFTAIVVEGRAGDDRIVAEELNGAFTDTETTTFDGEGGNDTLLGGIGAEILLGGAGSDVVDGNRGFDTVNGGDGADTFPWDPGDGSDVVDGGADIDTLAFNGANIGEQFRVAANGDHVRFTRDVANIALDLDGIDAINLRSLGGADTITVDTVTGTDLTTITTDLAASGGGDDLALDTIVVAPGARLGQDGAIATIDGLGAQVRITNGIASDHIHVTGATAADTITIAGTPAADTVTATANGTDVVVSGATGSIYAQFTTVELVDIDLGDGNDTFGAVGNLAPLTTLDVDGGNDNDTLLGGNGADVLLGGPGTDFIDGNQGIDTVNGGEGADTFQWDPGDGSDIVDGGNDIDTLAFNGSNIGEQFRVSANGDHVRFTRDVANIALDLDGIDTINLRSLGGADTITIDPLTGTDLTTITTDLAASIGGTSDGVVDQVIVSGTSGDDQIAVVDDGAAVVVQGLSATVRITGADPTLDRLRLLGAGGVDTVTATPAVGSLIVLELPT